MSPTKGQGVKGGGNRQPVNWSPAGLLAFAILIGFLICEFVNSIVFFSSAFHGLPAAVDEQVSIRILTTRLVPVRAS